MSLSLQGAEVTPIPLDTCASALGDSKDVKILPEHMCAKGISDTCNGDSGSPVYWVREGREMVFALTSFGGANGCGGGTVFQLIGSYWNWVRQWRYVGVRSGRVVRWCFGGG